DVCSSDLAPGRAAHRQPAHRWHAGRRDRSVASRAERGGRARRAGAGHSGGRPGPAGARRRPAGPCVHRSQRACRPGQPSSPADRRALHRPALSLEPERQPERRDTPIGTGANVSTKLPEPDLNYLQRVLLEMLAIPSPTGFTDTIVRYVAERLNELGTPSELTRRGTIRATLKGRRDSPDRAIAAHLDTIGAIVREIHDSGRLGLSPVGCWSSRFAEAAGSASSPIPASSAAACCPCSRRGTLSIPRWTKCRSAGTTSSCASMPIPTAARKPARWASMTAISWPSTRCASAPKAATAARGT